MIKFYSFLLLLICSISSIAQDLKMTWAKPINYDRKNLGIFNYYVNSNEKYVYGVFYSPSLLKPKKATLVAFDKNSMKIIAKVAVWDKSSKKAFPSIEVMNDVVYTVSRLEESGSEKMYGSSYTLDLKKIKENKLLAKTTNEKRKWVAKHVSSLFSKTNKNANDNLYIIGEEENKMCSKP